MNETKRLTNADLAEIKKRATEAAQYASGYLENVSDPHTAPLLYHARQDVLVLVDALLQERAEIERLRVEVNALERVLTKKQDVTVRVRKETEYSSWENFPY